MGKIWKICRTLIIKREIKVFKNSKQDIQYVLTFCIFKSNRGDFTTNESK